MMRWWASIARLVRLFTHTRFNRPQVAILFYSSLAILTSPLYAQTQNELRQIDASLKQSQKVLAQNQAKRKQTLAGLQSIEMQIAERTLRFDQTRSKIKSLEELAQRLQEERDKISRAFNRAQQRLSRLLESAYLMGRQGGLKIALSQQGTQYMARLNHYAHNLSSARQNQLDELQSLQRQLAEKDRVLQQEQNQLNTLTTALTEDKRYLGQLKINRLAMLEKMDKTITDGTQEIVHLRARKARLEALLADIAKRQKARAARKRAQKKRLQAIKNKPPAAPTISRPPQSEGSFTMPARAKIIAKFGDKRKKSGLPWNGILMQASEGTDIKAIGAGEIVFADWLQGYGQLVIIDHGNGLMSLYGHNKRIHRTVGEFVKQSDIIAAMGDTAGLKKPALYFEIRKDGVAQDPLKWLKG